MACWSWFTHWHINTGLHVSEKKNYRTHISAHSCSPLSFSQMCQHTRALLYRCSPSSGASSITANNKWKRHHMRSLLPNAALPSTTLIVAAGGKKPKPNLDSSASKPQNLPPPTLPVQIKGKNKIHVPSTPKLLNFYLHTVVDAASHRHWSSRPPAAQRVTTTRTFAPNRHLIELLCGPPRTPRPPRPYLNSLECRRRRRLCDYETWEESL